jgi:hypothetical protein
MVAINYLGGEAAKAGEKALPVDLTDEVAVRKHCENDPGGIFHAL